MERPQDARPSPMRLAFYQPDQPGNVGAMLRLGACLGLSVDIIAPCGFPASAPSLRRAAMDYAEQVDLTLHDDWEAFRTAQAGRLLLLTTQGSENYCNFGFNRDDILLLGSESRGVPPEIHAEAVARLRIPLAPHARSLNVVNAAAMVVGEALRQTKGFPS